MLDPMFSSESDSDHEWMAAYSPESSPNKRPLADDDFDWDHWEQVVNSELRGPAPAKQPKYENQVEDVQQPNAGPLSPKPADEDLETWKPQILESSAVYRPSNPASKPASSAASQGPHYPSIGSLGPSSAPPTKGS